MHPLCSSLKLRQEGESLTQVSHLTLQICINIKLIRQASLCCCGRKPVIRTGIQTKLEASRQPNKTLCFSSGSSNCTSPRLCLLLLGNWVALLSRCDSSVAHYSSCCQRKRQQHQPCSSVVIIMAAYLESYTGKHLQTLSGRQPLLGHKWCTHAWLRYSSKTWYYALSFAFIIQKVE